MLSKPVLVQVLGASDKEIVEEVAKYVKDWLSGEDILILNDTLEIHEFPMYIKVLVIVSKDSLVVDLV